MAVACVLNARELGFRDRGQEGQRQDDLCEFEASLVYRWSSRTARTIWGTLSQKKKNKNKNKNNQRERKENAVIRTDHTDNGFDVCVMTAGSRE
jgi:hypothetical protein